MNSSIVQQWRNTRDDFTENVEADLTPEEKRALKESVNRKFALEKRKASQVSSVPSTNTGCFPNSKPACETCSLLVSRTLEIAKKVSGSTPAFSPRTTNISALTVLS